MLYGGYDIGRYWLQASFNAAAGVNRIASANLEIARSFSLQPDTAKPFRDILESSAVMLERAGKIYIKQHFGIEATEINGQKIFVTERDIIDKPFCTLKRFCRDTTRKDPKVLLVALLSGHYATLLRDTVETLLPSHDVYITDWKNARDIPLRDGSFGLDDYVAYVQDFIRTLGSDVHVIAVCQPTVPVLAAISLMAEDNDPAQPLSLTLMAGPIDTNAAPTAVSKLAEDNPIEWFRANCVQDVPFWYGGAGRKVYPGYMQLSAFVSMNPERHVQSHADLFNHLVRGNHHEAQKIIDFYDEYFAVSDLPGQFYLDTVQRIFQDRDLACGRLMVAGRLVRPEAIKNTALFTVEGGQDDIAAPGQTVAAHDLVSGLPSSRHYHYVQEKAGHYGVFSGRKWRDDIAPRVAGFIRQAAPGLVIAYDAPAVSVAMPDMWKKSEPGILKNRGELLPPDHP